ncbi:shikimate kinase [Oceanobacillus piezotolerans]|uniref:Shikimate kinase n=1 Tax=Oceanobacillus piezotolerans TaxID=2448030 RepID=A0A498DEU3_9BACI|nr:AAA family ATPase [Oceanobacillus piezotolerans]RLL47728.1 shikimate kinase [Oceanobacillus piezotolerans]
MKLILLFGPQAVGKMTVGQELERLTGLPLLHNHKTIDLLSPIFGFSEEMWRLSTLFRYEIFKSVAKGNSNGVIFTFVWAFNEKEDWKFVEEICQFFESEGREVYLVELEADLEKRLERNKTSNRLEHKPSKRDIAFSERELLDSMDKYRLQSFPDEIKKRNYIRINNTNQSPHEVARKICEAFILDCK